MADKFLSQKGQGILESAFVIILMVLLLGAIINIWAWANSQIVKRQLRYNASRVAAGESSDTYVLRWPVYAPEALGENKVLLNAPEIKPGG